MSPSPILAGEPFSKKKNQEIVDAFFRDGFAYIPDVLERSEVEALRVRSDELLDDPTLPDWDHSGMEDCGHIQRWKHAETGQLFPFILRNTLKLDAIFRDMLVREPILSLAETIVGEGCKFCGQNTLRNIPGLAIEQWHNDGPVIFPLPDELTRHDPRVRMPVLWFTVQIPLTDVDSIEQGPTQYVPGSHCAGRGPGDEEDPHFEGKGPASVFCKAGDIYLHDPSCWHRGAPNRSDQTRVLFQQQYAAKWAWQRFSSYNRVPMEGVNLSETNDTLLGVLGRSRER